jgi:hypothetical protein
MTSNENNILLFHAQRFSASAVNILNLLVDVCSNIDRELLSDKDLNSREKLITVSKEFIGNLKNQDQEFEYNKFIKKVYRALSTENAMTYLLEKNENLFTMKDDNKKIITIIPGVDIRFAFRFFDKEQKRIFWPNFYLFVSSSFSMIHEANHEKMKNADVINNFIAKLNADIVRTKIHINETIFNPFVGLGYNDEDVYSIDKMYAGTPNDNNNEQILSMLGVEKIMDIGKIESELNNLDEDKISEATNRIISLLGAEENSDVKEVCDVLIKGIVVDLQENGVENIYGTLKNVAEKTKGKMDIEKMRKTANAMKELMNDSSGKLNDLKDENGIPVGKHVFSVLSMFMNQKMGPQKK